LTWQQEVHISCAECVHVVVSAAPAPCVATCIATCVCSTCTGVKWLQNTSGFVELRNPTPTETCKWIRQECLSDCLCCTSSSPLAGSLGPNTWVPWCYAMLALAPLGTEIWHVFSDYCRCCLLVGSLGPNTWVPWCYAMLAAISPRD
jgi:hypothetical protein